MSFGGSGGGDSSIAGATDVTLSNPATDDVLSYSTTNSKWGNLPLAGKVAFATGGGEETVSFNSSISGSFTIDLSSGNVFSIGLTGDVTFTFTDAAFNKASSFGLYLYAAGGKTITWPSDIKWQGGEVPTLTGSGSSPDVVIFETLNGSTWHGMYAGNFSTV